MKFLKILFCNVVITCLFLFSVSSSAFIVSDWTYRLLDYSEAVHCVDSAHKAMCTFTNNSGTPVIEKQHSY